MGYHPETLAFSFPPYPRGGMFLKDRPQPWSFGRWLYGLSAWIGFEVWHIDPQNRAEGQRRDDSCGWFDRRPGPYADAVAYVMRDKETMHEISRAICSRAPVSGPYGHTYPRMPLGETLAITTLVADELETRRWWNGQGGNGGAHASWVMRAFTYRRNVGEIAHRLALSPVDNLSSIDDPEELVSLVAGALHRHFRPWWKHPRWHVHHWQINFHLLRNLRRMFQPCGTCKKRLGFGYCPTQSGGKLHHGECLGIFVGHPAPMGDGPIKVD